MQKSLLLLLCVATGVHAEYKALPEVSMMYEILERTEQLQTEIQQMRGFIEEQSQAIDSLKQLQNSIYSDLDLRLKELTRNNADSSSNKHNKITQFSNDNSPIIENYKATIRPTKNNLTDKKPPTTPAKNQKELYQAAFTALKNGYNIQAIQLFKSFLKQFPDGEYTDNSYYWLGEAYITNQDIDSAKAAFIKVITHHSKSPKIPGALLKLGLIELAQNNKAKAIYYLTQITTNYPNATVANLASKKLIQIE